MKYYDILKKMMLPNKAIDQFLIELHHLCKKHKITISSTKGTLAVEKYDKNTAQTMLSGVVNKMTFKEKVKNRREEPEIEKKTEKESS